MFVPCYPLLAMSKLKAILIWSIQNTKLMYAQEAISGSIGHFNYMEGHDGLQKFYLHKIDELKIIAYKKIFHMV